jgi:LysM repeat protein
MSKKNNGSVLNMIEPERHRVAASIPNEQDWEQPEPNSGLARMFVIMLFVHVFVIGGIIIYDFIGSETSKPGQATASAPTTKASSSSTAAHVASAPLPTISSTSNPAPKPAPAPAASPAALSVPDKSAMPKAIAYKPEEQLPPVSAARKPVEVARANTLDPIAFKDYSEDPKPQHVAPVKQSTPPSVAAEEVKPKAKTSEPKPAPEQTEDKPKYQPKYQPKPVSPPSVVRKALANDSKPAAATVSKKKDKEESTPPAKKAVKPRSATKYTIAKGDTVYSLARKYKVSEDSIMKANGITDPKKIQIGQKLKIPAPTTSKKAAL